MEEVLNWKYPFKEATQQAAKTSVTALRRQADELDDEAVQEFRPSPGSSGRAIKESGKTKLNAADTGKAHHRFLQHFSFGNAMDAKWFAAEAKRLQQESYLSELEAAVLDLEALAHFWNAEVGKKIRANPAVIQRELAFTAGFKPEELDEAFVRIPEPGLENEIIVVQGVADLVALLPKEIWLLDFKTDDVRAKDLPERAKFYSPQLRLYARALEKIYARPVTNCWLHFLSARETIPVVRVPIVRERR